MILLSVPSTSGGGSSDPIVTPNVIHVTTAGNDTTGEGSLAKPYLTAQKGYDVGKLAAVPFKLMLGKGSFSIVEPNPISYLKCVEGVGFDIVTPGDSLTSLNISAFAASAENQNGTAGPNNPALLAENLFLVWSCSGQDVSMNGSSEALTGGAGGSISVYGDAVFSLNANGGNTSQANGEEGIGGSPGSITVKSGYLVALSCQNGEGTFSFSSIPASVPGTVSMDGVDASLCSTSSVVPTITAGRCSMPATLTITTDKGGNASY